MPAVQLESVITCPLCGHQAREQMPTDACQFFYGCTGCGVRSRRKRLGAQSQQVQS